MKYSFIIICIFTLMAACGDQSAEPQYPGADTTATSEYDEDHVPDTVDVYSGSRFRNVKVERIADSTFEVSGEAQVFEAAFSWIIEDGHNELKKGYVTADAGAPAWGKFSFEVTAAKPPNTVPQLILFEASAKDGSRQHELPIVLYRE